MFGEEIRDTLLECSLRNQDFIIMMELDFFSIFMPSISSEITFLQQYITVTQLSKKCLFFECFEIKFQTFLNKWTCYFSRTPLPSYSSFITLMEENNCWRFIVKSTKKIVNCSFFNNKHISPMTLDFLKPSHILKNHTSEHCECGIKLQKICF